MKKRFFTWILTILAIVPVFGQLGHMYSKVKYI